jgi:16S rRNA (guanine966-N2)-methyltransferase
VLSFIVTVRPSVPKPRPRRNQSSQRPEPETPAVSLRIIGGTFRGRKLLYHGDPRTRPMKDRVRESVFNLISTGSKGRHAIDLFAGTGALGLEAISRGAERATFVERHQPTAAVIRQNAALLGVEAQTEVISSDTFFWARNPTGLSERAWLVFSSPPYEFYLSRLDDMLRLIEGLIAKAPSDSVFVIESDERFDPSLLPGGLEAWDVRDYPPARIAIMRTGGA